MIHIYKASAGSGKTYRLAYEYLRLLLGYRKPDGSYGLNRTIREHHRRILAITFTNKATEEMKHRIIHELAVLAGMEPGWKEESPYKADLMRDLHCGAEDLRDASRKALTDLLYDFGSFNVSTIDAFFQTILRTFAREAELTGNFELEIDREFAINTAVARMLSDISQEDSDTAPRSHRMSWIVAYMESKAAEGRAFNVFNRESNLFKEIVGLIGAMLNEHFSLNSNRITEYLSDPARLGNFMAALRKREAVLKTEAVNAAKHLFEVADGYAAGVDGLLKANLRKFMAPIVADGWLTTPKLGKTVTDAAVDPVKQLYPKAVASLSEDDASELMALVSRAASAYLAAYRFANFCSLSCRNLYVLGLLGDVLNNLKEYCNENNLFLIGDTNDLLRRIIGDDEVPFIYERIGMRLSNYLIDEFQDTSHMQWMNLQPLINESLGTNNDNLIIGDEKQCIYRFRNSDPSLLHSGVQTDYTGRSTVSGDSIADNTNWRSSAEVVRFNNTFFRTLGDALGFGDTYANVVQQVAKKNLSRNGYVKLTPISVNKRAKTDGEGDSTDFAESTLALMFSEIERQIEAGYKPKDIVILTRRRQEAHMVIDYIFARIKEGRLRPEITVVSDDALAVSMSPAVRQVVSLLRYITSSDVATGKRMSARRIAAIMNRYEYLRSRNAEMTAAEAIEQAIMSNDTVADRVADDFQAMDSVSLVSMVENIIRVYITPEARDTENMYITAFQDLVSDFCERGEGDILTFLQWWDQVGNQSPVSSPENENALRVMTVHKSKGLEFRCIHIPFANWRFHDDRGIEWYEPVGFEGIDPELVPPMLPIKASSKKVEGTPFEPQYQHRVKEQELDELNATYVAFTRAVDELIVQYNPEESGTLGALIADTVAKMTAEFADDCWAQERGKLPEGSPSVFVSLVEKDGAYTVGKPTHATAEKAKATTALDPDPTAPVRPMPRYDSLERNDVWNQMDIDREEDFSVARERGRILHRVMQNVRHASDIPSAVRRLVSRGVLPDDAAEEVEVNLKAQVADPEVRPWFEGYKRVLIERPICSGTSTWRPDRVVWTADGHVDVVDYKFGEENPHKYAAQVRGYIDLLAEAGVEGARGFVWYIDSGKIVRVQ